MFLVFVFDVPSNSQGSSCPWRVLSADCVLPVRLCVGGGTVGSDKSVISALCVDSLSCESIIRIAPVVATVVAIVVVVAPGLVFTMVGSCIRSSAARYDRAVFFQLYYFLGIYLPIFCFYERSEQTIVFSAQRFGIVVCLPQVGLIVVHFGPLYSFLGVVGDVITVSMVTSCKIHNFVYAAWIPLILCLKIRHVPNFVPKIGTYRILWVFL